MKRRLTAVVLAALVGIVPSGCAKSKDPARPPDRRTLTGRVEVIGYLVDDDARFAGTRVLGDADGIPVELLFGGSVVASTTTVDGVYTFPGLVQGVYRTRTTVVSTVSDLSNEFTIADADVAANDTLRLESYGDLYPVPNPVVTGTQVFFEIADTVASVIRILDSGTSTVRVLNRVMIDPSLSVVNWNGLDDSGQPTADGLYWITLEAPGDDRAQALFREHALTAYRRRDGERVLSAVRGWRGSRGSPTR